MFCWGLGHVDFTHILRGYFTGTGKSRHSLVFLEKNVDKSDEPINNYITTTHQHATNAFSVGHTLAINTYSLLKFWDKTLTYLPQCRTCASVNRESIGSDNGLPPIRRQAITRINTGLMSIGP